MILITTATFLPLLQEEQSKATISVYRCSARTYHECRMNKQYIYCTQRNMTASCISINIGPYYTHGVILKSLKHDSITHYSLYQLFMHIYSINSNNTHHIHHCKNKVVTLQLSIWFTAIMCYPYYECRAGKGADTSVNFTSLPQNVLQAPHSYRKETTILFLNNKHSNHILYNYYS